MKVPIQSKFKWQLDLKKSWTESFYPSTVKKIQSSHSAFESKFTTEVTVLTKEIFEHIFQPLYDRQVTTRSDYRLDKAKSFSAVFKHIEEGIPYFLFGVYDQNHTYVGGIVYAVYEQEIRVAYRVFDREVNNKTKQKTTLDYWSESKFYDHIMTYGKRMLRHGVDQTLRKKGMIGLIHFKLSIGAKPCVLEGTDAYEESIEDLLKTDEPYFFFSNPDEAGYYTASHLIHGTLLSDVLIGSLKSVLEWSHISLQEHD